MTRGRPAKPTRLKELAGNPGKRAINRKEPKPTGAAEPPKTLTKDAAAIWKRVVAAMPVATYTRADESLIAAYCEAVALHRRATAEIDAKGMTVAGSTGQLTISPFVKIQADQARLIVSLGGRLGLDPASRQSLHVEDTDPADDGFFGLH